MPTDLNDKLWELSRRLKPPTVNELFPLVVAYYAKPGNDVGGTLHIVLDDKNVEDEFVIWTEGYASGKGDEDGRLLAGLLRRISEDDRIAVVRRI